MDATHKMTGEWVLDMPFDRHLSLNDRSHWATRARDVKAWRDAACVLARHHKIPACGRILVELHYYPRVTRRRDQDNLVATMKACVDGIVDAKVVPDDTPEFVERTMPVIHPATGHPNRFTLRIVDLGDA